MWWRDNLRGLSPGLMIRQDSVPSGSPPLTLLTGWTLALK
jgi:hypothetical protein